MWGLKQSEETYKSKYFINGWPQRHCWELELFSSCDAFVTDAGVDSEWH